MTDEQFKQLMETLDRIKETLTVLAVGAASQDALLNSLVEALTNAEEPASTDAYFNQRLLRGADLHGDGVLP